MKKEAERFKADDAEFKTLKDAIDSTVGKDEPIMVRALFEKAGGGEMGVRLLEAVGGFPVAVEDFKKIISSCLPDMVSRAVKESVAMAETQKYVSRFLGGKIIEAILMNEPIPEGALDTIRFSPHNGYAALSVFGFETVQIVNSKKAADKIASAIENRIDKLSSEEYDVENKAVNDPKIESLSRAKRDLENSFEPPADGVEKPND